MKKICLLMTIIVLISLLSGCCTTCYWEFDHSYEDIVEIKIINLDGVGFFPTKDDFTVIKELDISQAKELYDDITDLQMQRGGLSPVEPGGNSFLIVFANGEFDIISIVGSTHCKYDNGVINSWISFLYSNEMEYEQLLNKYLNA